MSSLFKKNTILFLLLISASTTFGQEVLRFKGQVKEQNSDKTIPFVTIRLKDVALGTIAEVDGSFAIKLPGQYAKSVIVFSCVGYEPREVRVDSLKAGQKNLVFLEEDTQELEAVVVEKKRRMSPIKVLKKAIQAIPENYPNQKFTFDAYYRERLFENGAVIKFSDAATTIQQSAYDGKRVKRQGFRKLLKLSMKGTGINTNSVPIMSLLFTEFLHDHFSVDISWDDRAYIHDARASLNLSKENFNGTIPQGPLGTLSKDLVRFLDFFMLNKNFKKYRFELLELPNTEGGWDYQVKFSPKKPPLDLAILMENSSKGRRTSRQNILSGEIVIDQETFAIKKLNYRVDQDYRRHICNLQEQHLKHYGYNVSVNYRKQNGKWQLSRIHRESEFIIRDTLKETVTPYLASTDLIALDRKPSKDSVAVTENFLMQINNHLYDYPLDYKPDFWKSYEAEVPQAVLDTALRADMEMTRTLEEQFADKHLRDESLPAPVAAKVPVETKYHGVNLKDDYHWLKDTTNPAANEEVMNYLRQENAYSENYFRPLRRSERQISNQFFSYIDTENKTEPVKRYNYWYWSKYEDDGDYRTIYRRKDEEGATEEVLLDINKMAADKEYFDFDFYTVSPDNRFIAVSLDSAGHDYYTTYIQDLESGKILADSVQNIGSFVWSEDSRGFFYSLINRKTNRSESIRYHVIGTGFETDSSFFYEADPAVELTISKSSSKEFLYVYKTTNSSSQLFIARNRAPYKFKPVKETGSDEYYSFTNVKDKFYILTNIDAPNGRLMISDTANVALSAWEELVPESPSVNLIDLSVFDNYLVLHKKENMREFLEVINRKSGSSHVIREKLGDIYALGLGINEDFDSDTLKYFASAPNYRTRKVAYHMPTRRDKRTVLVKDNAMTPAGYSTKLVWAEARDGAKIPVTLIYWGKLKWARNAPVYVEAYGAYGQSQRFSYDPYLNLLLDRNFLYAYVHVRGGGDMGKHWYDQGKMSNKLNSFHDLIDAVNYLTDNDYGDKERVFGSGASAGGLLMAGVVNMEPELFQGVFLDFPFVDVINTMSDEALPLTVGEFTEWGNPANKEEFDYIMKYSPYENIRAQDYPRMAFYTGLRDKNVGYWEPAKMVARIRENNTGDNVILLRTDMNAGHGPSAGRTSAISFVAYKYAILLEWLKELNEEN